jgi:hypothetical protein
MNFKKQADILETFLDQEFKTNTPLLVLKNNSILYKKLRITQTSSKKWQLLCPRRYPVAEFYLKTSAAIAAKYYDSRQTLKIAELKSLDFNYWQSAFDVDLFKFRSRNTKDSDKVDIYLARLGLAEAKKQHYKRKITSLFALAFDK